VRLVDSHCHIDGEEFDADRADVLARARAVGVSPMIVVGTGGSYAKIATAPALAEREPDVFAAVGVHPHDAARIPAADFDRVEELARHPRVVAVGETGLDYYYDHSPKDAQAAAFRRQIRLARRIGKPVVCHIRDAHADALAILVEEKAAEVGGVIHCFTGGPADAKAYVAAGFHVSWSGIVTFGKSAAPIREAVKETPIDRILVETDSPYLAPVPVRGKRCEPAFVVNTAAVVAIARGLPLEELAAATVANAFRLFGLTLPGATGRKPAL
jgi:TatD DNase family protein